MMKIDDEALLDRIELLEAELGHCRAILRAAGLDGAQGEAMLQERQMLVARAQIEAQKQQAQQTRNMQQERP